jgi:oxygen-independent coproporphyrinogen III oxidase|tara:strand:+ start:13746 stop:14807 length:1062 start_codon:yes stop_codon:yes gene_type:complete
VNLKPVSDMVKALNKELTIKAHENTEVVKTIYFGGGTPSVLSASLLHSLLQTITRHYLLDSEIEITIEANPDDINYTILQDWFDMGINRLSIGIQTFRPQLLESLNRSHNAIQAIKSIDMARKIGFTNISADLMFALPEASDEILQSDLETMVSLGLPHISVYGLTIEEKTVFGQWKRDGTMPFPTDEVYAHNYRIVHDTLVGHNYEHYEISNFAKKGFLSKHNTSYWFQESYIGIGPGAHSFNGTDRKENISNNQVYLKQLALGNIPEKVEKLSQTEMMNEYIMTHLRTQFGLHLSDFRRKYGFDLARHHHRFIHSLCQEGLATITDDTLKLTFDGFLISDEICAKLFFVDK